MTVALILDACFIVVMALAKAGIVYGLLFGLAREETELSFRKALAVALVVDIVYLLNRTGSSLQAIGMAVVVAILVGGVAVWFWFGLDWGKAVLVSGLAAVFSVGAGAYAVQLLDDSIPDRPSVAGNLIDTFDGYVRTRSGIKDFVPSESLGQAMYAALHQAVAGTVAEDLTGPVRAGMETVNKVKAIQAGAAERVAFIDSLSDSGINTALTDASYDMARHMEENATGPSEAAESNEDPPAQDAPVVDGPVAAAESNEVAVHAGGTHGGTGTMVLRGASTHDPDVRLSSDEVVDILRELTPQDRRTWAAAQEQIRVRSTLKYTSGKSAAVVNGSVLEPGGIVSVTIADEFHAYQLVSVGYDEVYWTPVQPDGSTDLRKLLRMTF